MKRKEIIDNLNKDTMYFIIYQPEDRSYTKFISLTEKLTDDLTMAFHSMDLDYTIEKCHKMELKDRKGNYLVFRFVR